jgi:competence protein ComEC
MCAASILLKRRALSVFLAAAALGFVRMLPHTLMQAEALDDGTVYALASAGFYVPDAVRRLSESILARCDAIFNEASPLVRAIVLGDTSGLSYFDNEAFRAAGVSHILALSGLNASILAEILAFFIPKRRPGLRFASIAAFLFTYLLLSAFPASLVRACVMALCMHAAPLFARKNDPLSSLALAFVLIALSVPFSLFSAGFMLSFSATAGILMLCQPILARLANFPKAIAADLSVTLSATLATLPFTLLLFQRLPLYSLAANFVVVPLVTLSLPLAIVALLGSVLWMPLGSVLAFPVRLLAGAADYFSKAFASLPYSVLRFESPPAIACVLYLTALVFVSKYCLLPTRKRYALSASLLAAGTLALIFL